MTYIEFFDLIASENVCACLTYTPDRVIYLGDNAKQMAKHIEYYKKVFDGRGQNIEFLYKTVSKSNLDNVIEMLSGLVETYDDCVFDITGGDEMLILALGMVYAKYPEKNIQIQRFNLRNNSVCDCDKDGNTVYHGIPTLSVEENVRIYGGEVVYGGIEEDKTYKWELTPEFLKDVELIWNVCKGNVRLWNMQIGIFEAAEEKGKVSEDGLTTVISRGELDAHLRRRGIKYKTARGIISYLCKNGLLTCFEDDEITFTVSYKNPQVKRCLTTAGQALELKVYVTAKNTKEKNGELTYDDALNGVVIDWDGSFHDEETEGVYDTENEIDVLLMHDTVPVFISCKNGVVTADELYKLDTVAKRFGGRYSKKVLIATSLDSMGEAGNYLRQRAQDMNIRIVDNFHNINDNGMQKLMRNLWM